MRALGLVYVIAFSSLLVQVAGLIGDRGVLPASTFLAAVHEVYGARGYWLVPTLAWFGTSTTALQGCCVAGLVAGALIIINRGTRGALLAAWALYLSLLGVGQAFLSFQWDTLLLEAGVLALLATWWPARIAWLFRWLLFRLLFLSGAVKLLSGDESWRGLTALTFHFQTQPLPNIVSWYVHQLPLSVLEAGTVLTFIAELLVPLLYFVPRSGRLVAAAATVMFQVMIFATGNYAFFNLLTIAITVWLLDDRVLSRWVPRGLVAVGEAGNAPPSRPWQRSLVMAASAVLVCTKWHAGVRGVPRAGFPAVRQRGAGPGFATADESIWAVCRDDHDPARNRVRGKRGRRQLAGVRVQVQAWGSAEATAVGRPASAATRLADVVCRAEQSFH